MSELIVGNGGEITDIVVNGSTIEGWWYNGEKLWPPEPYNNVFTIKGSVTNGDIVTLKYIDKTGVDNIVINWGDGNIDTKTSSFTILSHGYTSSANITITITGGTYAPPDVPTGDLSIWLIEGDDLTEIVSYGELFDTTAAGAFRRTDVHTIPNDWRGLENVTNIDRMLNTSKLTALPDSWKGLDNVTTAYRTFEGNNITTIPSTWQHLENLVDGFGMLKDNPITDLPKSFMGLDKLETATFMLYNLSLTKTPNNFQGLNSIESAYSLYTANRSITRINSWVGLETCTRIEHICRVCDLLEHIPSSWKGLENVYATNSAFSGTSITDIPTNDLSSLSNVTECADMFEGCAGITGELLPMYNQLVTSATSYNGCFSGCVNAVDYHLIPSGWK